MSKIIVYVEQRDGTAGRASLEALGAAASLGAEVIAVVFGAGSASIALSAARTVALEGEQYSPDALAADIAAVANEEAANAVFCASTGAGRDLAPRVAALMDCPCFSDCTAVAADGESIAYTRPTLAGKLIANIKSTANAVATLRRNCFEAAEGESAVVAARPASTDFKALLVEIAEKTGGKLDVSEAPIIVSGGRGMKDPSNFKLIEDLAAAFGNAAVGASRAVVDAGWRPHSEQVGQTGKTVAPQLYFAIGISGAIQHVAGMKTSKVIVAINKDPDAAIFKLADYGIVGDAMEIVPALTEAVKGALADA
jgi:electron transfer flavoprotein alpha subunit